MRFRLPLLALTVFVATLTPGIAWATPLTWEFSGVVDKISGFGWASVDLGDPFAWTVTFDPETLSLPNCPAGSGEYIGAITGSTLSIGGYSWTGGWGAIEANAPAGNCGQLQSGISFREFDWTGDSLPGTSVPYNVVATLYYPQISDGSIPKIPPPSAFVQVNGPVGGPSSLTVVAPVPVPEPATLTLVGSGLVLMIRRRYLRRNR